ncbi:MAG: sulfotransferase domain-containing protein [Nitrospirae bacterium]|nr:sulfotransferase domain-containing protein [Nitrospirota bacterium]
MAGEIVIVSGLPRSGTSMMMRMLSADGMEVAVDNERKADEDNPCGYYELEQVKQIREDNAWLDELGGKVVKMISMLLFDLPSDRKYKIIFMKRDLNEILASQRVMLQRRGEQAAADNPEMETIFGKHLAEIKKWLGEQPNIEVIYVNYRDILDKPLESAGLVARFLGSGRDAEKMASVVDPSLYRQRSSGQGVVPADKGPERQADESEKEKIEEQLKALGYM